MCSVACLRLLTIDKNSAFTCKLCLVHYLGEVSLCSLTHRIHLHVVLIHFLCTHPVCKTEMVFLFFLYFTHGTINLAYLTVLLECTCTFLDDIAGCKWLLPNLTFFLLTHTFSFTVNHYPQIPKLFQSCMHCLCIFCVSSNWQDMLVCLRQMTIDLECLSQ